jgi:superfamily II DNA or RNA helicase
MTTKTSRELSLHDRLSRLGFLQACKLLGENGGKLIQAGARYEIDIDEQVSSSGDAFRLQLPSPTSASDVVVTITRAEDGRQWLRWNCSACETACEHAGAAFSLILEEKMALGLAAPPPERTPVESLGEEELVRKAVEERAARAGEEKMKVRSADPAQPWTDYTAVSAASGKTYRVALRGEERGASYCSCPDFRTNTLGTCKHIMHVLEKVKRRFPAEVRRRPYRRTRASLHLHYGQEATLRLLLPAKLPAEVEPVVRPLRDRPIDDLHDLVKRLGRLQRQGYEVTVYPDAEEYIQQRLFQDRIQSLVAEIRKAPESHPLRKELLKVALLPYQLDGVAFAVGAGRAVLADDMGLGKTIQGVGVAELLGREAGIRKVLVICPASLKSQWRSEIRRFCDRDCQLVLGSMATRAEQYGNECFFTVCNYEQVLRDILAIERVKWDLIILDEGQRIKNWEAKTSNVIKSLKSPFALVLSGTPLENRLDELYSVVQFIDDRRLAPAFRFFNRHRVADEKGKVLGYKNLAELRENLRPLLLRRTRDAVMQQLPPRTTEIVRIPPTDEQLELHGAHMRIVATIIRKRFLTEMDLLRLQKALLMCRMAANSTYLVDKKEPGYSTKLQHLDDLLDRLFQERGRKVVLFSEWTTMLDLIQPLLESNGLRYVRLDGSVPQKQRQQLVHEFQHEPDCHVFITTNAGSLGLNLQAANTVINVDLPWNPAVLEQRIGRAHRMGQDRPVQVYVLVTEETIEDNLLATLAAKRDLALAALDAESDVDAVDMVSGIEELKQRLEVLLGARPEAPLDQTVKERVEQEAQRLAYRDRVAAAGGELLGAAFRFLGQLVPESSVPPPPSQLVNTLRAHLSECVEEDAAGKPRLTVTLPDRAALDHLADTLARLMALGQSESRQTP